MHRKSNRKGVLDMQGVCERLLPNILVPDTRDLGSWLSSRLLRDDGIEENTDRRAKKTMFQKRQDDAATLSRGANALTKTDSEFARQMFKDLYDGVVLAVPQDPADPFADTDVCIVTDVIFHDSCWHVRTDHACVAAENMGSFCCYVSAEFRDTLDVKIASGSSRKPGLGTYIKLFNSNQRMRMALELLEYE